MTKLLYMDNSYLKEFEAEIVEVSNEEIVLDQTAFYPRGGGLPEDTGVILKGEEKYIVDQVRKEGDKVFHHVANLGLSTGDKVRGIIDWEKRYTIMRMHTGIHALASVFNKKTGALITGNQVGVDKSRLDVNIEKFDRKLIEEVFSETNQELAKGRNVKIYYLPREEAFKIPGIVKLAEAMPPDVEKLRIVEIEGLDIQADGGPHVSNTKEVGELVLNKVENKGKNNRRVYFTLKPEKLIQ
ncbi:MAG: alanyl-tRNA editing protein [Thaumarchaeota archaeon]|jgi:Ser-tRNA(Ala) deacylase AlaX|nr:alanyl-tRNA editing protein [Nitrososphaerota archaeon]